MTQKIVGPIDDKNNAFVYDSKGHIIGIQNANGTFSNIVPNYPTLADVPAGFVGKAIALDTGLSYYGDGSTIRQSTFPSVAIGGLSSAVAEGVYSQTLTVLGDSTGYNTWMWVYQLALLLAARYPTLRIEYALFSNVSPYNYTASQLISAGDNQGARSVRFTGVKGRYQVDSIVGNITGDMDVSAQLSMDNWNTATQCIASRYDAAAGGWSFQQDAGKLELEIVTSAYVKKQSTVPLGFTAGQVAWVRFTYVAATGLITFYTSTDGAAWTQLGATVSATVTGTVVQTANKQYEIGSSHGLVGVGTGAGVSYVLTGNIYNVRIRQGIDGPIMNSDPIESWVYANADGTSLAGSQTLYIKNGSIPGATLGYLSGASILNKNLQDSQPNTILLSCSHNDTAGIDSNYFASWDSFIAAIKARSPQCNISILTQNPNVPPATFIEAQGQRSKRLITYAQRNNINVIDTYKQFVIYPQGPTALIGLPEVTDNLGVHPNAKGGLLQAQEVFRYLA